MNNTQLIVILFGILYLWIIIYTRHKGNFEEFAVAGRSLGFFLIFSSMCASYIGPGFTMGLTREGFSTGLFMTYIAPVAGIMMLVVGILISPRIRSRFTQSNSIGDVIGGSLAHDNKLVKTAAGLVSLFFLSSITIAMSYAGGELINNVFGFPKFWSIAVITIIVMIYSYFGGIRATMQTDTIQFLHFVVLIPLLVILVILGDGFSWETYWQVAGEATTTAAQGHDAMAIFGLLFLWLFSGSGLDGPLINRMLSARNVRIAQIATIAAGAFIGLWIVLMLFLGSTGAVIYPDLGDSDQILLYIAEQHYPGVLYGIFIIAMIGVVMSSQDSLLNGASVNFGEDVLAGIHPGIAESRKLMFSRIYTVLLGVVAIAVASFLDSVLHTILTVTAYYVPIMIPVTLFSILKSSHHWQSALVSMGTGLAGYIAWQHWGTELLSPLIAATVLSTLAYLASDLIIRYGLRPNRAPSSAGQG